MKGLNVKNENVKYHMVEAEEVVQASKAANNNANGRMKKNKVSSWQAFPIAPTTMKNKSGKHHHSNENYAPGNNGSRKKSFKKGSSNGNAYRKNNSNSNSGPKTTTTLAVTAANAKAQIEYYFTPDNLVRDTFLRQNMDVEGYVPVIFVANFHAVLSLHQDYPSLLNALNSSDVLELDTANEKIRARTGWQKWLWPNATGGYGLPLYIKEPPVINA